MKKIIYFLILTYTACPAFSQVNLTSGLVAYYPFSGNANDASGNGFHGTLQNSPSLVNDKNSSANSAYSFNGSNQYIRLGDILDSVFCKTPNAQFTISGWAKTTSLPSLQGGGMIINKAAGGSGPDEWFINHDNDGKVKGLVKSTSLTDYLEWRSDGFIPAGLWFSYVLTFDGSVSAVDSRVQVYINGVPGVFSRKGGTLGTSCQNSTQEIIIGAGHTANNPTSPNNQYSGTVDEVRIYNRVLNMAEIAALSGINNINLTNGLAAYYPFSGNANDASGNGFHGTLQNTPALVSDKNSTANSAYSFNGSNQYIRLGDILDSVFCKTPNAQFTISGWAKTTSLPSFQGGGMMVSKAAGGSGPDEWFINHDNDGKVKGLVKFATVTDYLEWRSDAVLATGQWFNYVLTFDGSVSAADSRVQFYVNGSRGVFSRKGGSLGTFCQNAAQEIIIGGGHAPNTPTNPSNLYNGTIDEVRIYNRVLNLAEIDSLSRLVSPSTVFDIKPFSSSVCTGDSLWIKYGNTGKLFNSNCTYVVQRSDSNGSFSNPVNIGGKVNNNLYNFGLDSIQVLIPSTLPGATYRIRVVTNSPADTATWASLQVFSKPQVAFQSSAGSMCYAGNQFSFTNNSSIVTGSISSYQWNFGDSTSSSQMQPVKSYTSYGSYTVQLTAHSDKGCVSKATATLSVYAQPVAAFTPSVTAQCFSGNQFSFNNTSSIGSGSISNYNWTFGDGNNSGQTSPSKNYGSPGSYPVKLVVTSDQGCKDSTTKTVNVYAQPTAAFTPSATAQCFSGNQFSFNNTSSIGSGSVSNYSWTFGDGNNSGQTSPTKNYSNAGVYSVKLVATSDQGCKDSTTKTVNVYPQPVAVFSVNNSGQCFNANSFSFTNTSTISSGSISANNWAFGDGNNSTQISPTKNYSAAGTYTVMLTTTSDQGCKDSSSKTVSAYPHPSVNFSINNATQCFTGHNYVFTDNSSLSQGTISAYQWAFGDGNNANTQNVSSKTYTTAGSYSVQLTATSNQGCQGSLSQSILLKPNPAKPTISRNVFTLTATAGTGGLQWYKDNAAISGATSTSYIVTQNGSYTVEEILNGCSTMSDATVVQNVGIGSVPEQSWMVYPNPSKDGRYHVQRSVAGGLHCSVYDSVGRLVMEQNETSDSFTIDLSRQAGGVYMLQLETESGTQLIKLIR